MSSLPLFRRVHKIAKSDYYLLHVCLSVRIGQLGSHWTDFHEVWYLCFFRKSVEKIQVSLKSVEKIQVSLKFVEKIQVSLTSDNNNGYFTWKPTRIFFVIPHLFLLKMRRLKRNLKHTFCVQQLFPKIVPLMR